MKMVRVALVVAIAAAGFSSPVAPRLRLRRRSSSRADVRRRRGAVGRTTRTSVFGRHRWRAIGAVCFCVWPDVYVRPKAGDRVLATRRVERAAADGEAVAAEDGAMSDTARPQADRFTVGSTMRHVMVMSATGWVGLAAIFFVDFLNLFYISLLQHIELTAAIGFAGALLFLLMSFSIGGTIAGTALTARAIGARRRDEFAASPCRARS